jgi:putative protease
MVRPHHASAHAHVSHGALRLLRVPLRAPITATAAGPATPTDVRLRDRVGAELPLKADAGCRNTVYNNRAQTGAEYLTRFLDLGARAFRIEFIHETADEVVRTLGCYRQLLRGEMSGADLWRELKVLNQLGVTRGQLEATPQVIRRKS